MCAWMNLGAMEEQLVLLTVKPSLWLQKSQLKDNRLHCRGYTAHGFGGWLHLLCVLTLEPSLSPDSEEMAGQGDSSI